MAAYLGYSLRMKTLFRGWPLTSYGSRHAYEKKKKIDAWPSISKNTIDESGYVQA